MFEPFLHLFFWVTFSSPEPVNFDVKISSLQMSNQDVHALFGKVNSALALASDWFKANKLTLHPSKTKYIFFSAGSTFSS